MNFKKQEPYGKFGKALAYGKHSPGSGGNYTSEFLRWLYYGDGGAALSVSRRISGYIGKHRNGASS